jgi:pimeloyl-ACP methyl ester carboxylesterase
MAVDEAYLAGMGSFQDEGGRFREDFVRPPVSTEMTLGVLSRPTGPSRTLGWVLCPAFGSEQMHLLHLETLAARALASAGFPVLRFHGRGYGDSESSAEPTLSSHLADAADAVRFLQEFADVANVGVIGARLGGAVAMTTAVELGLRYVAMWQPAVDGRSIIRDARWRGAIAGMLGRDEVDASSSTSAAGPGIEAMDLLAVARRFSGWSLLIAASSSGALPSDLTGIVRELEAGGRSSVQILRDQFATRFGGPHHRYVEGKPYKQDVRRSLDRQIAHATAAWAGTLPTLVEDGSS